MDIFEKEFEKKHDKELWIESEKKKIITNLIDTRNLSPGSPYHNKVGLPDDFVSEIFLLTKKLHVVGNKNKTGVWLVSLSADFEKTGGYDLFLDPNTKLSSYPFRKVKDKIGKLVNSYKIVAGNINFEIPESDVELLNELITSGNGPTIRGSRGKGGNDKEGWVQSLSEGDSIEIVIDRETNKRPLIKVNSKTTTSSIELFSYISKKERADVNASFEDFFTEGKLKRVYQTHLENCSRNNRRAAWESQRIFKVKIMGVDDTKAKRRNRFEDAYPKMGKVWTSQQANVLSHHGLFDIKKYTGYLNSVKRGKEVGIFSSLDKTPCVIFHFKTFENQKFKHSDIENKEMGLNWNKWLPIEEDGQYVLCRMKRLLNAMRVCSFPMVYHQTSSTGAKKRIEKTVVEKKEDKEEKGKFVLKTPTKYKMKKEMIQAQKIESSLTAEEMNKTVGLRKTPMFLCNLGKKDGEFKSRLVLEPTEAYKTRICSGISNFSLNRGGIEHIMYDSCIKINIV